MACFRQSASFKKQLAKELEWMRSGVKGGKGKNKARLKAANQMQQLHKYSIDDTGLI